MLFGRAAGFADADEHLGAVIARHDHGPSGATVHVFYDDATFDFMTLGDTPEDIAAIHAVAASTVEALRA